jgi:hypothetical protein
MKTTVENLINSGKYTKAVNLVAKQFNIKLEVVSSTYGTMLWDKNQQRYIFKLKLKRGRKSYTFEFGQSIVKGAEEPTLYDVLACLQKYDVGSFEDFCGNFGYDEYASASNRTYKAVVKEFKAMERLFSDDELEILNCIN